ncbi:hypothetical protein [Halostagnicola sp. A-GB9-2]|uniref:hypothetical protein n=1 Tax=Halostagnicola sp. A-GB9-2 TaxID=3048066 RepID=UPI0024BF7185|nr:hypothetical protein [Halostagnicola sp. A-GB9-2]MDJ1431682.1 hypothetical protein [Halostagnicola sp. A-GB9-2]
MSNQSSRDQQPATTGVSADGQDADPRALEQYLPSLAKPIRVGSFWLAIVLPFLYVPLLVTGLSSSVETGLFLGLLVLNIVVLYVGHSYQQ